MCGSDRASFSAGELFVDAVIMMTPSRLIDGALKLEVWTTSPIFSGADADFNAKRLMGF